MSTIAIGLSTLLTATDAGHDAAQQALADAKRGPRTPVLGFLFATEQYDDEQLVNAVHEELGELPWVGTRTAGVIAGPRLFRRAVGVGLLCSEGDLEISIGLGGPLSLNERESGRTAVASALAGLPGEVSRGPHLALCIISDPLVGDSAEALAGAFDEVGAGPLWVGGGGGDSFRFQRTCQYFNGRALNDHIIVVAIQSQHPLGVAARHGWQPHGVPMVVTRSSGHDVLELNYAPAFDMYRKVAAELGAQVTRANVEEYMITHPLGIPQANGQYLLRAATTVSAGEGLRCLAEVPEGTIVRLMTAGPDIVVAAGAESAQAARQTVGTVGAALLFDCAGRCHVMADTPDDALAAIQRELGQDVPLFGFLTYGEIAGIGTAPRYNNFTAVVLALPG